MTSHETPPDEKAMLAILDLVPNGGAWIKALRKLNHLSVLFFHDYACDGAVRRRDNGQYVPVTDEDLGVYLQQLRSWDAATFKIDRDREDKQKLIALIDFVRFKADATRALMLESALKGGATAVGEQNAVAAESKGTKLAKLRTKPAIGPGAGGANEPPDRAGWTDRAVMLVLTWLYLAGSAVWLKLILLDGMLLSLDYDLLYEREYADPKFRVARGLSLNSTLGECTFRPPPAGKPPFGRLLAEEDGEVSLYEDSKWLADELGAKPPAPPSAPRSPSPPKVDPSAAAAAVAAERAMFDEVCPFGDVIVNVTANLRLIENPSGPLYLVVYASNDWKTWWQASKVDPHESLFTSKEDVPAGHVIDEVRPVSTLACVREPGFAYLIGCLTEGYIPGKPGDDHTNLPPFGRCISIDGVCGATCMSDVHEPSHFDPSLDSFGKNTSIHCVSSESFDESTAPPLLSPPHADGLYWLRASQPDDQYYQERFGNRQVVVPSRVGRVRLDDIEAFALEQIGLTWSAYMFAVMYMVGVFSSCLMYAPALGQKEKRAPTWSKLSLAIEKGRLYDSRHTFNRNLRGTQPAERPRAGTRTSAMNDSLLDYSSQFNIQNAPLPSAAKRLAGTYPVSASISASEHQNIVLRNTLGRICANLNLLIQFEREGRPLELETELTLVDILVDEGHRLGIYYLYRSVCLVFYACLPHKNALAIATAWLRKINVCIGASSTDDFDHVPIFDLLEPKHRKRSEFILLEYVHSMVGQLNQFKTAVPLFDKMLQIPILGAERQKKAMEELEVTSSSGSADPSAATLEQLHRLCELDADLTFKPKGLAEKGTGRDLSFLCELLLERCGQPEWDTPITLADCLQHLREKACSENVRDTNANLGQPTRRQNAAVLQNDFFMPLVFQRFGRLLGGGMRGKFKLKGELRIPLDVAAFAETLSELPKAEALASIPWANLKNTVFARERQYVFSDDECKQLREALDPFHLCFDHVVNVLGDGALHDVQDGRARALPPKGPSDRPSLLRIGAVYAARGNPTLWKPKTKPAHRRTMHQGVWICENPEYPRDATENPRCGYPFPRPSAASARRGSATQSESLEMDRGTTDSIQRSVDEAAHAEVEIEIRRAMADAYWRSRERVGLVLDASKTRGGMKATIDWFRKPLFAKQAEKEPIYDVAGGAHADTASAIAVPLHEPANTGVRFAADAPAQGKQRAAPNGGCEQQEPSNGGGEHRRSDSAELMLRSSSSSSSSLGEVEDMPEIEVQDRLIDAAGHPLGSRGCCTDSGPAGSKWVSRFVPLNVHLGKAGGLNFGMQAVLMTLYEAGLPPPSEHRPMFYAITDARHAGDERWWLHTLPPFFNIKRDTSKEVAFDKSIAFCQVAHAYLGIEANVDYLDMRNDFMFTGMAVVRDQAYGMTSCGTGGIWSITRDDGLDEYFFGRTMIEDTASSTEAFLQGRKSVYVTPFANKPAEQQLMCAVPKVSANFLEALERWDKGAVQCFCAQAICRPWFFRAALIYSLFAALFLVPACWPLGLHLVLHHSLSDVLWILKHPLAPPHSPGGLLTAEFKSMLAVLAPCAIWLGLLVVLWVMMSCAPVRFNRLLRSCVLFFNHTYPFNAVTSVFWVVLPIWITFSGEFPFRFDPIFAIGGGLVLRAVEWILVITYKGQAQRNGTQLREVSIFKSQQLNMATVPIKLRACVLGLVSGWRDVMYKHDNSFWISFGGTPQAVVYVQLWLSLCMLATAAALITGTVRVIVQRDEPTVVMASVFGMVLCFINGWILLQPFSFVMRNRVLRVSLRHTEVVVLVVLGIAVIGTLVLSGQTRVGIFAYH